MELKPNVPSGGTTGILLHFGLVSHYCFTNSASEKFCSKFSMQYYYSLLAFIVPRQPMECHKGQLSY